MFYVTLLGSNIHILAANYQDDSGGEGIGEFVEKNILGLKARPPKIIVGYSDPEEIEAEAECMPPGTRCDTFQEVLAAVKKLM